ncbi:hypothetical protein D3C87_1901180 [compost metagenome]
MTDILLRFFGTTTDMRCQDHVRQAEQFAFEHFIVGFRLLREHVDTRASHFTALHGVGQCFNVDHVTA